MSHAVKLRITSATLVLYLLSSLAVYVTAVSIPAGLRPAKKVGESKERVVPMQQQSANTATVPKVPPNLTLRSRMMAALSSASGGAGLETENNTGSEAKDDNQPKAPLVFTKGTKKVPSPTGNKIASNTTQLKDNVRVVVAPPAKLGKNNYGLNTVLQTNLVDSKGRVMKNVTSVPIKVPSSDELKNSKTRHTAKQVESDADKVVPIKFGSSSR